jgi:DNA-directed RNA polymerase subunit RPC12/RpoP
MLKQKYSQAALEAIKEERATSDAVSASEPELDDAELLISKAKAQRQSACPTCRSGLEPGSIFCSTCGRSLTVADALSRCWVCGAEHVVDAKFCAECGAGLAEAVTASK